MEQPKKRFRWFDPRHWSFIARLTLLMILLVIITLVGVTFVTIQTVRATLTHQIGQDFEAQARSLAGLVGVSLQGKVTQLQVLALSDTIKDEVAEHNAAYTGSTTEILAKIQRLDAAWVAAADNDPFITRVITADPMVNPATFQMADLKENIKEHVEVFITDRYGATVAATGRLSDYYQADETWWQAAWNDGQGAVYIASTPEFDESAGVTAILLAVPIYSEETGEAIGVLRSTLTIDDLIAIITEPQFGQTGHAVLFNGTGEVLFDPSAEAGKEGSAELALDLRQAFVSQEPGFKVALDTDGDYSIFGHAQVHLHTVETPGELEGGHDHAGEGGDRHFESQIAATLENLGWATVVRQETPEAFASVDQIVQNSLMVGLAAVGLGSLVALFMARTITRPLIRLGAAAEQIGLGNLDTPLPPASGDEIGRLSGSFRNMAAQLRSLFDSLEQRVASRTHHLEIIARLGERLNAILNLEKLLAEVVNQVKDKLGYYHAHIYLLDDTGEKLVVVEGTGPAGAEMKLKGHNIPLDAPTSLVARAARTGQIVSVDNVRQAPDWLPNPLLPNTYSEMAVPITLGVEGQVVGVLDVQQDKVGGLDQADANLFRSLANQIAVAIHNARLFTEVETALNEAHELQRRYFAQAWDRTRVTRKSVGRVQFSLGESTTLGEGIIASAQQQVLSHQKPAVVALTGQPDGPTTPHALVAPVMLRDVMIGDLQLHGIEPDRAWTESELALINAVIDQVAQTAENLRLLDETQERASREQLVSQISNKMRRAPDMESLMKVAVAELAHVLDPARTFVRLDSEATLSATPREIAGNGGSLQPEVDQT